MSKHKLDDATDEILQHFGVKGMKWGVSRTDAQIAAADDAGGGGGGGEEEESFLEEMGDKLESLSDALGKKMGSLKASMKKKGFNILVGIFGKAGDGKARIAKGKPLDKKTQAQMKKYINASPAERKLLLKGYKVKSFTTNIESKNGKRISNALKESKKPKKSKNGKKNTNGGTNGNSIPKMNSKKNTNGGTNGNSIPKMNSKKNTNGGTNGNSIPKMEGKWTIGKKKKNVNGSAYPRLPR